jgi:hypothetical protein
MTYDYVIFQYGPTGSTENVQFNLDSPNPVAEYVLESVSGLGPPPIDVIMADKVFEGGTFQGRRPQNREIVMLIGFRPLYTVGSRTVADLRRNLYGSLTPKGGYVPTFHILDLQAVLPTVSSKGYIKNIEPNIFSKDPQVQITMQCDSPYFSHAQFTHPTPGSLNGLVTLPITNAGDAPTGFDISIKLLASTSSFVLTNTTANQLIRINYAFLANDTLRINTINGERNVTVTRGAVTTNLLNMMSLDSIWLQLVGGLNNIVPNQTTYQIVSLRYTSKMWGF